MTQSHGSQPLQGKAEGQPGYRLTQCKPDETPGRKATDPSLGNREGQPGYQTSARGGTPEQVEEVLRMRLIPIILVVLLPSVMLASVTVSTCTADVDSFISIAREAMKDGNYIIAFALYECALRRDPHSSEALAGRLMARAFMVECCSATQIQVTSR